jgi:hypothetical protein
MKTKFLIGGLLILLAFTPALTCSTANKIAYESIGATEESVLNANRAYLEAVITGKIPTNDVPKVEARFNEIQMGLTLAAKTASLGTNSPTPADIKAKATQFVTDTKR